MSRRAAAPLWHHALASTPSRRFLSAGVGAFAFVFVCVCVSRHGMVFAETPHLFSAPHCHTDRPVCPSPAGVRSCKALGIMRVWTLDLISLIQITRDFDKNNRERLSADNQDPYLPLSRLPSAPPYSRHRQDCHGLFRSPCPYVYVCI